jgi:SAM-dependent methyltransferase
MMAVSREEVVWAYRLLLGREPENEAVIALQMGADDRRHLREAFLSSQEFQKKFDRSADIVSVNRFLEAAAPTIDIRSSPEQLQTMIDRIGSAWKAFGESEPHWSVLTADQFLQGNLEANLDAFYRSGVSDIDIHLNYLHRAGLPARFGKALDFGCGVGRLTVALAPYAEQVVGIDISPPHLKLAVDYVAGQEISNIAFESIATVDDLDRYSGFDLIISRIVLQHNPPPVMAALYRKLLNALAPGGVAIVQMPTYIPGQTFSADVYLATDQPAMEMNALPQAVIFEIIEQTGCRPLEVREDSAAGHMALSHTYAVVRP